MALAIKCEKGHTYIAPDILRGEPPKGMPAKVWVCPECQAEWLAQHDDRTADESP